MNNINKTYGERIEKSPSFAKDIVIVFSDDVSVETMKKFQKGKDWMEAMISEIIIDWNLEDGKSKLPINLKGLDKIKSIKLRNWIINTMSEIVLESLSIGKKK